MTEFRDTSGSLCRTVTASDVGLLTYFPRSLLQEEVCLPECYSAGFSAASRNSMGSTRALLGLMPLHSMDGESPRSVPRVVPPLVGHPQDAPFMHPSMTCYGYLSKGHNNSNCKRSQKGQDQVFLEMGWSANSHGSPFHQYFRDRGQFARVAPGWLYW